MHHFVNCIYNTPRVSNVDFQVGNYVNNGVERTTEGYENHNAIGDIALAFFIILTDTVTTSSAAAAAHVL